MIPSTLKPSPAPEDRYRAQHGRVLLNGTQALVRLLLLQSARDRAAGLHTAGFVSGYRGSPLGGLDQQLWQAEAHLREADIRFQPGVNEDLAATAIWGTQQVPLLPGARFDGVFSLWYGKGPGVDRSGDPFKHGNRMGASRHGGVLLAFGDDHGGKSSTVSHQSEHALASNDIPVLYPATLQEYLELGLHGWALSRFSGLWVGLKCVNETVETTATVEVDLSSLTITNPPDVTLPPGGLNGRIGFDPLGDEVRLTRFRIPAAHAYALANRLDRVVMDSPRRRLGIVCAGKSYLDVREALSTLGIDTERASQLGIGLYKVAMIWPCEPQGLSSFARGFDELLFVEEKRPFLEDQAARILYNLPDDARPRIVGKLDHAGKVLFPSDVQLDGSTVAAVIAQRLSHLGLADATLQNRLAQLDCARDRALHLHSAAGGKVVRTPYFCSGCPHNTSTRIPEGSLAFSGIGCHTLAIGMNRNTVPPAQMGGEGLNWTGIAPFTDTPHAFQNLGDGTYFHSGLLAVRAAINSGANITYKLLVNDAVAMTGGQPVEGGLTVNQMTRQLSAEGVKHIAVVSDEPLQFKGEKALLPGIAVHHRNELAHVQRQMRELPGTTAIVYVQTCATEKRRRRKRGRLADPQRRVFINDRVCEGCGDCSVQSNCVSVEPLETPLGRKRRIDQSSCNKDYSCVRGFCPSFVTVEGGTLRKPARASLPEDWMRELPEPDIAPIEGTQNILITGVGGTGVVTLGAILAMAAHLEDKRATVFDMTGLAQKGGAVMSHVRIASTADAIAAPRIGIADVDVLLGCDLVVSCSLEVLRSIATGRTRAAINEHLMPTAQFQLDPDMPFHRTDLLARLREILDDQGQAAIANTTEAARTLLGDTVASNMMIVGAALQKGWLPVGREAIERAIEINGAAVELNRRALSLGRLAAHDPQRFQTLIGVAGPSANTTAPETLESLVDHRSNELVAYQNAALAQRYRQWVRRVELAERRHHPDSSAIAFAAAREYFRLLSIKDEYEVARLYTDGEFHQRLQEQFDGPFRLKVLLAPPLLSPRDKATGEPRKIEFGSWMFPAFRLLARLKVLRGTAFDLFGYTAERRRERTLIRDYEQWMEDVMLRLESGPLSPEQFSACLEVAGLPAQIRGYGHVRARNETQARNRLAVVLQAVRHENAATARLAG